MEEKKTTFAIVPANWRAPEEMIQRSIAALKETPENLWERFKHVELTVGELSDDFYIELESIIQKANHELNPLHVGDTLFQLRKIARKEIGIIDKPAHVKPYNPGGYTVRSS